jgi:lipopolysaccharide heptosyltransferase II
LVGAACRAARRQGVTADAASVRKILVIRLDLLGDVLLTMPLVEGLKHSFPEAHLTMLVLPYTAPLARLYASVDEVVEVDTNRIRSLAGLLNPATWSEYWRVLRRLRAQRFDLCVSAYGRMGSLCAFLVRAGRSVGYASESYPGLLSDSLAGGRYRERIHEVEYVRLLALFAGATAVSSNLELPVTEAMQRSADLMISAAGIAEGERMVLIHAGSVNGSAKRWPAWSWAQFSDAIQETTSARVVLIGTRSDEAIANQVHQSATQPIASLVGLTDIATLAGVISRADLVATGDSGPMHMAVALGRPVLAVHGPTDPAISGPYNPRAATRVLRHDLPCSPCYTLAASAECPLGDPICMRLVTVSEMVDAAMDLLTVGEDELPVSQEDALQDAESSERRDQGAAAVADER